MDNSVVYGELNPVGGMIAGMFLTKAISVDLNLYLYFSTASS